MYASFFGLQRTPFSPSRGGATAPYLSRRHSDILAHLLLRTQGAGGMVLLTVENHRTDSNACRRLVDQIPGNVRVGFLLKPSSDASLLACLRSIGDAFRIPRPPETTDASAHLALLQADLQRSSDDGKDNVLILGHAQDVLDDVLVQLALLCQPESAEQPLMQLILVGSPALRDRLAHPGMQPLARQKITEYHLDGLNASETAEYIQHHMAAAGLQSALPFSDKAIAAIHTSTKGAPEHIDPLCDRSLMRAHAAGKKTVDHKTVVAAAQAGGKPSRPGWPQLWQPVKRWLLPAIGLAALALVGWMLSAQGEDTQLDHAELAGFIPPSETTKVTSVTAVVERPVPAAPDPTPTYPTIRTETIPLDPSPPMDQENPVNTQGAQKHPDFQTLKDGPTDTWPRLGSLWGLKLSGKDACDEVLSQGHQCFRSVDMTLERLRQMDRPGLLLINENGVERWVLLESMDKDSATLSSTNVQWTVPLSELKDTWRGSFSSIWRLPPGHAEKVFVATPGDKAGQWLNQQLKTLQERGKLPSTADTLDARLRAFQNRHDLRGDGKALPITFIQLNRIVGVKEPRLGGPSP